MADTEKLAYCHDCFDKLGKEQMTKTDKQFLAAESASWSTGADMKFVKGTCSKCGKDGEVIFY